jgi:hypothetical protein
MNSRRKRSGSSVLLPWERKRAFLSRLRSGRRVRLVLLSLLSALFVAVAFHVGEERARVRQTRASITEVQRAVAAFRAEMGRCPRSKTELVHPPRAGARYLDEIPSDGWGRELYIRCPSPFDANEAHVMSAGPSASFANDDNIL